jgi:hypothetical protein
MSSHNVFSSNELIRYIEAAGESANIDAKGPIAWDCNEVSAGLTKDILALANCRDGGVIVIGKSEPVPGKFQLDGVSDEQAASFETTIVGTWVNNHCAPHVHLVCYRHEHDGKQFIVIAVSEFHDVPVICTKQFELPSTGKSNKVILKKGTVYVRTPNAQSAPLSSVEELRELVGLATTKRADQMLAMFKSMMKGQPLLEEKPQEDLFEAEIAQVQSALDAELDSKVHLGAWSLICHPAKYQADRWEDTSTLKSIVEKCAVRVRREFPQTNYKVDVREWGICNRHYEDAFGFTRSGLFISSRLYFENYRNFKNHWQPNPDIPAGKWLDLRNNLAILIEFYAFLSRFAHNFDAGESIEYEVLAKPLTGRQLTADSSFPHFDPSEPCKANFFRNKKVASVEVLRANWEDECAKAIHGFLELFPGAGISHEETRQLIVNFLERKF